MTSALTRYEDSMATATKFIDSLCESELLDSGIDPEPLVRSLADVILAFHIRHREK